MAACRRWEEDLALLAGGDLPTAERESEVLAHVEACPGCRALLDELGADQSALAALRAVEVAEPADGGLAAAVLADLGREAAPLSARPAPGAGRARLATLARAAAVVLVGLAAVLAASRLPDSGRGAGAPVPVADAGRPETVAPAVPATAGGWRPVWVRRAPGEAVELSWERDGRETGEKGVAQPYRLLASASPRDFSGAQAVDVAGNRLVATMSFPTLRLPDRSVTFYRVQ